MGKKIKKKKAGLPPLFLERLKVIVPAARFDAVFACFLSQGLLCVRINTLKAEKREVLKYLKESKISVQEVPWLDEALVLSGISPKGLEELALIQEGILYRQGLSSMLPVLVLGPGPGEHILDMCAAPGSKTTQIAAMTRNEGEIVAVEAIRKRYYKLKSVVHSLGAKNISIKMMDARRFKSERLFDKILVDAPCSSEGRFKMDRSKTYAYWSRRKIREMARKQKGILLNASRLLRPGGVMVYSTCTFSPEENEGVADWLLRKTEGAVRVEEIHVQGIERYPALTRWKEKDFNPQVRHCLRVLPGKGMEAFFIAKFVKFS